MPKNDDDLFTRLRRAGVRKPVARKLSELGEDAGKKAISAGYRAVAELRVLADEIEKRLPETPSVAEAVRPAKAVTGTRRGATPITKAPSAKATTRAPASRTRTATGPTSPVAPKQAPRGENKAKILAALKTGPQTASEIGRETGIATATVSAALTRLSKSGDVTKAARGYALPD